MSWVDRPVVVVPGFLRTDMAEVLRKAKPPKPNMSFKQRSAVRTLRNDSNIVIVPADKGKATVVMDKTDYDTKMRAILQDDQYRPLPRDPTVKVENKIADTLKRLRNQGHLDHKLCDFLIPRYSTPPQMYGLPKIHKEDTPMRPIVSTINSPSYKLAKELARILTPLAGNTAYTVRNSTAFVERIRGLQTTPQDTLVSFDVKNLFTQVPVEAALTVVEDRLYKHPSSQNFGLGMWMTRSSSGPMDLTDYGHSTTTSTNNTPRSSLQLKRRKTTSSPSLTSLSARKEEDY